MNTTLTESDITNVYASHYDRMCRYIKRHTHCVQDAEELVQEAFIRALRFRDSFKWESKIETWILQIAKNLMLNHFRDLKKHPTDCMDDVEMPEMICESVESFFLKNEMVSEIRIAMENLPFVFRQSFRMVIEEERPYLDVAEELALSINVVKSRVFRARSKIRFQMKMYEA